MRKMSLTGLAATLAAAAAGASPTGTPAPVPAEIVAPAPTAPDDESQGVMSAATLPADYPRCSITVHDQCNQPAASAPARGPAPR